MSGVKAAVSRPVLPQSRGARAARWLQQIGGEFISRGLEQTADDAVDQWGAREVTLLASACRWCVSINGLPRLDVRVAAVVTGFLLHRLLVLTKLEVASSFYPV